MCWTQLYANKHKSHDTQNLKMHYSTQKNVQHIKTKKMSKNPTKNSGVNSGA